MELNPVNWSWAEWKAFGRHVASYAAGGVTVAVTTNLISGGDASTLTDGISNITGGVEQIAKGVAAIAGVLVPIYTSLMAKRSAEPANQAKAVADNLRRNDATPEVRKDIIGAVADMPEVKGVLVARPGLAQAIPQTNVVSSPADLPK